MTIEAVKTALALMGNASSHLSKERRKLVVKDLNKDAASLAEEDEMFKDAAPQLFGDGFETKLKQHVDAVRCLRKASTSQGHGQQFFRGSRPQGSYNRGGGAYRGRSNKGPRQPRFQPYQKENKFKSKQSGQ